MWYRPIYNRPDAISCSDVILPCKTRGRPAISSPALDHRSITPLNVTRTDKKGRGLKWTPALTFIMFIYILCNAVYMVETHIMTVGDALTQNVMCAWCGQGKRQWASQQTRDIDQMFDQCWPTVYDVGPTLVKHWLDVSCFLGYYLCL